MKQLKLIIPAVALVLLTAGCSISKFNKPPGWASVITSHERAYGLKLDTPVDAAGKGLSLLLGVSSTTWTVIPVATNEVFIPKISDTFSVGQSLNPFDTRIREWLQTGWEGPVTPPPASMFNPTP